VKRQFSKDGHVMTATSPAQAVRLAFDGWQEIHADPAPDPAPTETPKQPTPPLRKRTGNRS
jgi:hypothetical protein